MKKGDIVTIAEGEFAGEKGVIITFDSNYAKLQLRFGTVDISLDDISKDDEVKRIWMVFGEESRPKPAPGLGSRKPEEQPMLPKVKHLTKELATAEMERLAKSYPNKLFYLMESVGELKYEMELTRKERIYD